MWYAVIDTATGRLRSVGTVLPQALPDGLSAFELGETRPDLDAQMWDESTRAFMPRPPKLPPVDRLDDFSSSPVFREMRDALAALSPSARTQVGSALRTCFARFLGRFRYREQDEEVSLG